LLQNEDFWLSLSWFESRRDSFQNSRNRKGLRLCCFRRANAKGVAQRVLIPERFFAVEDVRIDKRYEAVPMRRRERRH